MKTRLEAHRIKEAKTGDLVLIGKIWNSSSGFHMQTEGPTPFMYESLAIKMEGGGYITQEYNHGDLEQHDYVGRLVTELAIIEKGFFA